MVNESTNDIVLNNNRNDYVVSAAKSALGLVPFAGAFLSEIAGNIIPNQRIDRIVKYAQALELRLSKAEQEILNNCISDEYFTDLVEESLRQAARSISDERRDYLSSLVANGILSKDTEFYESKHLMRILGELNDIEIIWLRYYLDQSMDGDKEFRELHKDVLNYAIAPLSGGQATFDKSTIQESYREHLASIGLLVRKDKMNYEISSLGSLLLREIGFKHKYLG